MYSYKIAGINIKVSSDLEFIFEKFAVFLTESKRDPELLVEITGSDSLEKPEGKLIVGKYHHVVHNQLTSGISIYNQSDSGDIIARIDIDSAWKNAKINYNINYKYGYYGLIGPLCEILFRSKIIFYQGLAVHAAALNWQGKGLLFSAPSGTGKTTQAGLWKRYKNAVVLNGDHPAVRMIDDLPVVFGTPWSGSSLDHKNAYAPVTAIIILQQAIDNTIRRLTPNEAVTKLLPRCFLPYFDENMMNTAVDTFNRLLDKVPVYLLNCRPEKEAVELVCQVLKLEK